MKTIPSKCTLAGRTQKVIEEGIQAGRWRGWLPGERLLSEEFRVSRGTVRSAFLALARDGWVEIQHGRPCAILPLKAARRRVRGKPLPVALLTPAPLSHLRQFAALWVDEFRSILQEQETTLDVLPCPKAYRERTPTALSNLVERHPHRAWVLLLSTPVIQQWFQSSGLPVVLAGSCHDAIQLPSTDTDPRATAVHAAHVVYRAGHRRVGLIMPRPATAGAITTRTDLEVALGQMRRESAQLFVESCDETKEDHRRAIDRLIRQPQGVTALILCRAISTLTAFSYLHSAGFGVPQDLSLLSLEWEPFLTHIIPDIACYRTNPHQFARRVARQLDRKLADPLFADVNLIQPQFSRGDSLGRPRKSLSEAAP